MNPVDLISCKNYPALIPSRSFSKTWVQPRIKRGKRKKTLTTTPTEKIGRTLLGIRVAPFLQSAEKGPHENSRGSLRPNRSSEDHTTQRIIRNNTKKHNNNHIQNKKKTDEDEEQQTKTNTKKTKGEE